MWKNCGKSHYIWNSCKYILFGTKNTDVNETDSEHGGMLVTNDDEFTVGTVFKLALTVQTFKGFGTPLPHNH